jgi:invasion protein IalB
VVEPAAGLGSCNFNATELGAFAQGIELSVDGQKLASAGYQQGRITADCLVGVATDAERRQFLIANTNWYMPD